MHPRSRTGGRHHRAFEVLLCPTCNFLIEAVIASENVWGLRITQLETAAREAKKDEGGRFEGSISRRGLRDCLTSLVDHGFLRRPKASRKGGYIPGEHVGWPADFGAKDLHRRRRIDRWTDLRRTAMIVSAILDVPVQNHRWYGDGRVLGILADADFGEGRAGLFQELLEIAGRLKPMRLCLCVVPEPAV